ncbi:MAG: hypothetical protein RL213_252 [Bacteroidota bacterium]|jgi:hypothetical protein
MRKLLLFTLLLGASFTASSQCVPDTSITHNVNGVYPDSATGLPHATQGQVYTTTIQLKVVRDTAYLGLPATVDSMNITSVTGLPSGFTYSCTPSNCSFPGGSNACILLQSTGPVNVPVATYPISVGLMVYGRLFGAATTVPSAITSYSIVVDAPAGISNNSLPTGFSVSEFTPNPAGSASRLTVGVTAPGNIVLETIDLLGNVVRRESHDAARGWNTYSFSVDDLTAGVYLTRVLSGKDMIIRRLVVSAH